MNKTLEAQKAKRLERQDREANEFAMALLMPEGLLRREVQRIGGLDLCDDDAVKKLARMFGVPQALLAIRLGQLMK